MRFRSNSPEYCVVGSAAAHMMLGRPGLSVLGCRGRGNSLSYPLESQNPPRPTQKMTSVSDPPELATRNNGAAVSYCACCVSLWDF